MNPEARTAPKRRRYPAAIADRPEVRTAAATQNAAEKAVVRKHKTAKAGTTKGQAEDRDDLQVIKQRSKEPRIGLEKVLAEYGR